MNSSGPIAVVISARGARRFQRYVQTRGSRKRTVPLRVQHADRDLGESGLARGEDLVLDVHLASRRLR